MKNSLAQPEVSVIARECGYPEFRDDYMVGGKWVSDQTL
jgi:hypothetical protein